MNESQAYEWLGVATACGYENAYLEVLGGGALGVTIPLSKSGNTYALMDGMGLGIYESLGDGEATKFYSFEDFEEDTPNWKLATMALAWMVSEL